MPRERKLPEKALELMRRVHSGQTRKHGTPYSGHPEAVARILLDVWPEAPTWVQETALLHDVIEKTDITFPQLYRAFGQRVASAVELLTAPPVRYYRYLRYYGRLAHCPIEIRLIKLADRIHNLSELHLAEEKFRKNYIEQTERYLLNLVSEEEAAEFPPAANLRGQLVALHKKLSLMQES